MLFSYIKRSKAGDCVQSQVKNLSRIKEPRTDSPWKRQILLSQVSLLSLPLVMCFLWEFFFKVFDSGQSDVSSGNSMTTCCVVNANILNTLIQLDNSKHRSREISRLSDGRKIHILSCNFDYSVPLSPFSRSSRNTWSSRFLSVRQIAQKHKLSKKFPTKNTSQYPWLGEEIRDWPYLKDLTVSWWISAQFFDAGEICELRLHTVTCLASRVGKQHRTNTELQNCIKWPWIEPRLNRKSNNRRKFT